MKVKGSVKVEVWFDDKIRLYGASYKDTATGNLVGDIEYGLSKTEVLKLLAENTPASELEYEKKDKSANRDY